VSAVLPDALRLGPVHLVVSDVDRSVAWYRETLGLRVHRHDVATAELGAGEDPVLVLAEDPRARPPGRHAGLFHYALLFGTREELAHAARRVAAAQAPIQGASDHLTHEAVYLADPDGIGIELAADRPRDTWPTNEVLYSGGPQPLDVEDLLASVEGSETPDTVAPGLRIGHVHLHVGDVAEGLAFYRDVLGFELQATLPTAAFVSAGGYHHHLAFNVWQGEGVGPAPEHAAGLRHWTIGLPGAADVEAARARLAPAGVATEDAAGGFTVRDPWGIALRVVAA
jgi:catechol 2,3-dioxygenase